MKHLNSLAGGLAVAVLLSLCCPDSLRAQNLIVGSSFIQLNGQVNGGAVTQNLTLSSAPTPNVAYTASVSNCVGGNWLTVAPSTGTTPQTLLLTATPGTLLANNYTCAVNFASASSNVGVTVAFNVTTTGGSGSFTSAPASLAFNHQLGTTPPAQSVTISSPVVTLFSATASTQSGGNWLLVGGASAFTGTTGTSSATFTASINPNGLLAGSYSGTIVVTGNGVQTFNIPVQLTVNTNATLVVAPTQLTFNYQLNTAGLPAAQVVSLSTAGTQLTNITATASTQSCGSGWLVVTPQTGQATPASLTVSVSIPAASPNVCSGIVQLFAPNATNASVQIPVVLNISNNAPLNVTPNALTLTYQTGSTAPSGTVALSTTGNALTFSASASVSTPIGGNWLSVNPANGITSSILNINTNPAGLPAGTYSGTVTISSPNAANPTQTVSVTLTVTDNPTLVFTPTQLSFAFQTNGNQPPAQLVNISASSGATINYAVTATTITGGGGWLNVTSGQNGFTPSAFSVAVNAAGLAAGRYDGTINISATGTSAATQTIPVSLFVSATALLVTSPSSLTYSIPAGSGTVDTSKAISVTSTDGTVINYNVISSTTGGAGWLLVGQGSNQTPSNISVGVNPSGLSVGRYNGQVTITSLTPGVANSPQTIPIVLNITPTAALQVSPASLTFSQITGQAAPANQSISVVSSTGSLVFSASTSTVAGGNWLTVTPNSGTTNNTLTVSVNGAGLPVGTYNGTVLISSTGASANITVPVALTVQAIQTITVSPATLAYAFQIGGIVPVAQSINISSSSGVASYQVATTTKTSTNWLSATPTTGTTPATVGVTATPGALTAGTYTGTVTVTVPGATNSPFTVNVTMVISPPAVNPSVASVLNAASNQPTAVSPGLLVAIFGTSIGPATPVNLRLTAAGIVDTFMGDTRALFDGIAAPLVYVSSGQVNAIVPYSIAGRVTVALQMEYLGVRSAPIQLRVLDSTPGIFTIPATGSGQGAILNQNGTVNNFSNPAVKGSVVVIYMTGEGQTNPVGTDGTITGTAVLKRPQLPVTVTVGGIAATVQYAGAAPFIVSGVMQVNIQLPDGVSSGNVPVVVTVGTGTSQANVTVAVQ